MGLKITVYCQHVLGIGHFHRSVEICRALAKNHDVTLISGGPPINCNLKGIRHLPLPGLQMDTDFRTLVPCQPAAATVEEIKGERKSILYQWFLRDPPDVFIIELYPFGRKAFRFELDPVLGAIKSGALPRCLCCSSVRDILVEKETGREKFEKRVVETVNNFFHLVLVHADPEIITLDSTFGRLAEITTPIRYTGFISKAAEDNTHDRRRTKDDVLRENISDSAKLIVASIGGGNVGHNFLHRVIKGFKLLEQQRADIFLQLFCGPFCPEEEFQRLHQMHSSRIQVSRFTDNFPGWLQRAALSLSMGGYNTCMDILQAATSALVHPFAQNREQRMRVELLQKKAAVKLLTDQDLAPHRLANLMLASIDLPHAHSAIKIDGAEETARQIQQAYIEFTTT